MFDLQKKILTENFRYLLFSSLLFIIYSQTLGDVFVKLYTIMDLLPVQYAVLLNRKSYIDRGNRSITVLLCNKICIHQTTFHAFY